MKSAAVFEITLITDIKYQPTNVATCQIKPITIIMATSARKKAKTNFIGQQICGFICVDVKDQTNIHFCKLKNVIYSTAILI